MKTEEYFERLVMAYSYYHPLSKSRRKEIIFETLKNMEMRAESLTGNREKAHVLLLRIRHLKNVARSN